jgi:hypothetical protein
MTTRTWPYGTKREVVVCGVETLQAGSRVLFCQSINQAGQKEMDVCLFGKNHKAAEAAREGDRGVLTFTEGGPTGGYWDYAPANSVQEGQNV